MTLKTLWRRHVEWRLYETEAAHRFFDRKRNHERRDAGIEAGLCPGCSIRPVQEGYARCRKCRRVGQRSKRKRDAMRLDAGQCIRCGNPRQDLTLKHCLACLAKAAKGREGRPTTREGRKAS